MRFLSLLLLCGLGLLDARAADTLRPEQLKPGMKGYGLSVFKGTQPERFEVEIIGVLEHTDNLNLEPLRLRAFEDGQPVAFHAGLELLRAKRVSGARVQQTETAEEKQRQEPHDSVLDTLASQACQPAVQNCEDSATRCAVRMARHILC